MSKKKNVDLETSKLLNIHELVGGNQIVVISNNHNCLACGFNGFDPQNIPGGGNEGTGILP